MSRDEGTERRRRSFFSGISVATRIAGAILLVSLIALGVTTIIGLRTGTDLGESLYEDQLVAMRSSAARDVDAELTSLERTVNALRVSPETRVAVQELSGAFLDLVDAPLSDRQARVDRLAAAYQDEYITPLADAGLEADARDILDEENNGTVYLQSTYSIDFEPLLRAAALDDAQDGSAWTEIHRYIHPGYRQIADDLGLSDLLLVDPATGYIVYSVDKRPDLGASVDVGTVSGSVVSALVDAVRADPTGGVVAQDFRRYVPELLTPVAGMAGGILDEDGALVGVLVALYDSSELTRILTADEGWDAGGFPPGGETYLFGTDNTTRSEPRGFLEDETAFLEAAVENGQLAEEDLPIVIASDSTVLEVSVVDSTASAARDGDTSVERTTTIDGQRAFSTVVPVPFEGLEWYVVAEVDAGEAQGSIDDFRALLVTGIAAYVIVLAFLAVAWAGWVVRPLRLLSDRLAQFGAGEQEPIVISDRSPLEMHLLAASYDDAGKTLRQQRRELADARAERLDLMRRMLPAAVADRLVAGSEEPLDESPEASIVVLTFALDAERTTGSDDETLRERIEAVLSELDHVAAHHGLDPIKVIGDEYYAGCGHERPYIDHAPRAVAFVAEAFDVVAEHGLGDDGSVPMAAGVASGPVSVGLTGTEGLVYDVWGTTVRRADQLARRAGRGTLLAADETVERLPDTISASAVDEVTGETAWRVDLRSIGDRA